jgi:hypothetical protein
MDAGSAVIAFTLKDELKTYLKRKLDTFINPLVYTFGGAVTIVLLCSSTRRLSRLLRSMMPASISSIDSEP